MADKINGPIPTLPVAGNGWQMFPGGTETKFSAQGTPAAYVAAAAPLLTSDVLAGVITYNAAGANNLQLPLATDLDAALPNAPNNASHDFSVIALGAGTATITTNTGWTLVGSMAVATTVSGRFRARKTAAGAWTLYRLS